MKTIKTFFLGTSIFFLGYYSNSFMEYISKPAIPTSVALSSYVDNSTNECKSEISLLENRLKLLTGELLTLRASQTRTVAQDKIPDNTQKITPISVESKNTQESKELDTLRQYFAENEMKKREAYFRSINATPDNMSKALSDNYNKEPVDVSWAAEQKARINSFVSQNKLLNSLPNVETDCRSKQCKISILSDDPNALGQLSQTVTELTTQNNKHFNSYTYAIDPANHTTSIFIDRNAE